MNITAIAIVGIICWAIVELVQGGKNKKKGKAYDADIARLQGEIDTMRERIATLEKIVTEEPYDLKRQFKDLEKDKVA
ncbi:hypothetical protein EYS14_07750 [Alteromonadaceae bacterium M269]|nr:hypothetical protein EYS14_07750 [Alteromonadaceae bacterium M269]